MKHIYVFFIFLAISISALANPNWKASAAKLSGDPEVRAEGVKELKAIKNLEEQLRMSFKENPGLVLQVIRNLKMHSFVPKLIEIIDLANDDLSSDVVGTTTFLASDKHSKQLTDLYSKKLKNQKHSDGTTLALLSGLEKFNYPFTEKELLQYLEHPSFEVRIKAVEMATYLSENKKSYGKVFQKAITTSPYQVRMVAYNQYLTDSDLKKSYQADLAKACSEEKNDQVKELCQKIQGGK